MAKKKAKPSSNTIAQNRRARFDYHISNEVEAGLSLQGWEVKSLRDGKGQLTDSFVEIHRGEAWLHGAHIQPLNTASTHYVIDPDRQRKLLLNRDEIDNLQGASEQKGYTIVCTALYWKGHMVKAKIGLAKGKKVHDKRETEKNRDWDRQKQRILRDN